MMIVQQSVECELARETEVTQCQFVHHKFHMTWDPGSNPDRRGGKPAMARPGSKSKKQVASTANRSVGELLLDYTESNPTRQYLEPQIQ
jgi:hypothetical protein